jgi:putative lipoic acid-binding regulatory protein
MPTNGEMKAAFDRIEKLLEFPVDFPIKIMGRRVDDFAQQVSDLVRVHVVDFDPATIELRSSARGNWLSLTATVRLESRGQLESLYRALADHPLVKVVL